MTAVEILADLRRRGIQVWASADGDTLRLRANGPPLEPELREELRRHKREIIRILLARTRPGPGRYRCAGCWAWFDRGELASVHESTGRGFRCVECLTPNQDAVTMKRSLGE